eukprot:TRINITY_DN15456_c0_g1_i1.p1 TRINITY_DN15456_c0_g1~~TRINITY_DN15456_c0_g1_i1.p1  ORF type:complete len:371 (-),score=28.51 TRINITY_DN15456_c0_g1_i1:96-1208(-)
MVAVWGAGAVSVLECVEQWDLPFDPCPRCMVLSALSLLTCIAVLFALCRVFILTRRVASYQTFVLTTASLQALCLVFLNFLYAKLILFIITEFLKVTTLLAVSLFFSTSALRMLQKDALRRWVAFPFFFLVGVGLMGLMGVAIYYVQSHRDECRDIPLLVFSSTQGFLALSLCCTTGFVFHSLHSPRRAHDTTFSHDYKIRHTRPMATLSTIYGFAALVGITFRTCLYFASSSDDITGETCRTFLRERKSWFMWVSMIYTIIDLLLPLWSLVWYFQRTVKESTYTSSSKMEYVWQSHNEEASEVDSTENGNGVQQPFLYSSSYVPPTQSSKSYPTWSAGITPYQTYRVEADTSEDDAGQDTEYTDLDSWQ